jgi:beta-galactosidase
MSERSSRSRAQAQSIRGSRPEPEASSRLVKALSQAEMPRPILSGSVHYFRVLPQQWRHRLLMLKALGLNTVDTYVPWNVHEPAPGSYVFDGLADVEGFLEEARSVDLSVMLRPGPYICSEWDNGGLPAWLLADQRIGLRSSDEAFLSAVDRWFDVLIPRLVPHQVTRGGNVILVQIENDYGRYGSDWGYLEHLVKRLQNSGVDVPLFMVDDPADLIEPTDGTGHVWSTVWFERDPTGPFEALRRHQPGAPAFCSEYVCGPFDHWGEPHHTRDANDTAFWLDKTLATGASVNLYMFHGGTNFGFWAGANALDGQYLPTVTSYDYDSPLDERGAPTEKFWKLREVFAKYAPQGPVPDLDIPTLPTASLRMTHVAPLFENRAFAATKTVEAPLPLTFEELGQAHGLGLYEADVSGPRSPDLLVVNGLADRAHVFVDDRLVAILDRNGPSSADISIRPEGSRLQLLVEAMGRVNWGLQLGDHKGITGLVSFGQRLVHGWRMVSFPLGDPSGLQWREATASVATPVFLRAELNVAAQADAFLALPGWGKGYVWINGFCLGRYWDRGPQRTLYVPWPALRLGTNELVVLELDRVGGQGGHALVEVREQPDLGA